jgi:hypothetical protein
MEFRASVLHQVGAPLEIERVTMTKGELVRAVIEL